MGRRDMRGLGIRLEHQLLEGKPLGVLRICGILGCRGLPVVCRDSFGFARIAVFIWRVSELRVGVGLWVSPVVGCKS